MCRYISIPVLQLLVALLSACTLTSPSGTSPSTPVAQPNGFVFTSSFTTSLPDTLNAAPGSGSGRCAPGSNIDIMRTLSGTLTATIGDIGPTATLASGVREVGAIVPDGSYKWSNRAVNIDCFQTGPTAGPVAAKFSFTHRSEIDQENQPEICIFKSRTDFSNFAVSGIAPLDNAILEGVKDQAHRAVDRAVAERISLFVRGTPFPPGAEPRCNDWSRLP